ncbi:MAG: hypothetical protein J6031_04135 [Bacteroidales bacterium]|nr:hypothetical protein [Bacteroidales bacterium]
MQKQKAVPKKDGFFLHYRNPWYAYAPPAMTGNHFRRRGACVPERRQPIRCFGQQTLHNR